MISWWRYLNRSVEKTYYFQHYTGYVGGGGGNPTRFTKLSAKLLNN
jgi:hypothetical protein